MKTRKIPMRMCVVTREKYPKQELIRVVRTPEGDVIVDESSKANGRGVYLKKDLDIVKMAKKKNIIGKVLETSIPDEVYEDLENIINK